MKARDMEKYLIVIEKSQTGFSAYSPDVPGCISTGRSIDKIIANMKSALEFHLRGLSEDDEEIPKPKGVESYLEAVESGDEEYFIIHIPVKYVLPEEVFA